MRSQTLLALQGAQLVASRAQERKVSLARDGTSLRKGNPLPSSRPKRPSRERRGEGRGAGSQPSPGSCGGVRSLCRPLSARPRCPPGTALPCPALPGLRTPRRARTRHHTAAKCPSRRARPRSPGPGAFSFATPRHLQLVVMGAKEGALRGSD